MNAKLKQKSAQALLLAFILASILFLLPDAVVDHDSGFVSSELEVKETVEKNVFQSKGRMRFSSSIRRFSIHQKYCIVAVVCVRNEYLKRQALKRWCLF